VVVEESPYSGGWGSEIAAHVSQELFGELLAPTIRICLPDTPVPYAASLESLYLPDGVAIRSQIDQYINTGKPPRHWWLEEGLVQAP
jgi:pyruvate dehydrogenase E1 component beta subunit